MTDGRQFRISVPHKYETRTYPRRWWRPWEKPDTYQVPNAWVSVHIYICNRDRPDVIIESDPEFNNNQWSWRAAVGPSDVDKLHVTSGPLSIAILDPFNRGAMVSVSNIDPPYQGLFNADILQDCWWEKVR